VICKTYIPHECEASDLFMCMTSAASFSALCSEIVSAHLCNSSHPNTITMGNETMMAITLRAVGLYLGSRYPSETTFLAAAKPREISLVCSTGCRGSSSRRCNKSLFCGALEGLTTILDGRVMRSEVARGWKGRGSGIPFGSDVA